MHFLLLLTTYVIYAYLLLACYCKTVQIPSTFMLYCCFPSSLQSWAFKLLLALHELLDYLDRRVPKFHFPEGLLLNTLFGAFSLASSEDYPNYAGIHKLYIKCCPIWFSQGWVLCRRIHRESSVRVSTLQINSLSDILHSSDTEEKPRVQWDNEISYSVLIRLEGKYCTKFSLS